MLRLLELNSAKMSGYIIKEYEPISIPQFQPIENQQGVFEDHLCGFIHGVRISGRHPIKRVYVNEDKSVILEFKDSFPNIQMSPEEYYEIWRKQNKIVQKVRQLL